MNRHIVQALGLVLLLVSSGAGVVLAQGGDPAIDWWVIAGGGAPSIGGSVAVNDTLGQPIIGPASGAGSVGLTAGYWTGSCAAAPVVPPEVDVAASGHDVVLTWDADPAAVQYQVWVATDPYFDPDDPGGVEPIVTTHTTYTDTGAAGDLVNHFYVVRGVNACGAVSANSERKGEFTFGLTPGS